MPISLPVSITFMLQTSLAHELLTFAIIQGVEFNYILRTHRFLRRSKVLPSDWLIKPDDRVQSILRKSSPVIVHDGLKIVIFSNFVYSFVAILVKLV